MLVKQALQRGISKLKPKSESYILDATILLEYATKCKSLALLPTNFKLSKASVLKYNKYISQRLRGLPIAYITREKEFFGINFYTPRGVLIPRPDTETLVEEALLLIKQHKFKSIIDLCTGSGVVLLSILKNTNIINASGVDASPFAIKVAKKNAKNLKIKTKFIKQNILKHTKYEADVITANPPYIKLTSYNSIDKGVLLEPKMALFGGEDGLVFYRAIANSCKKAKFVLVEVGFDVSHDVKQIFINSGYRYSHSKEDLSGIVRVMVFQNI